MDGILHEGDYVNNVLVLDSQLRSSLAIIRSLGRKGINVSAGSEYVFSTGALSKYSQERFLLPNPQKNSESFIDSLTKILQNKSYDCIFTSRTLTAYLLSRYQKELSAYTKVPIPRLEVFETAYLKEKTLKIAEQDNISVPKIYTEKEVNYEAIDFPVVIKSLRRHGVGIQICTSSSDLQESFIKMTKKHGPCVVQQYIPNGGEIGVYALLNNASQPKAAIMQRRIRTCYFYGGASTLRETIKDENLMKCSLDFLKHLNWTGVAMVEFRIDQRDGTAYLLEVNPRFWGSLELSIYAGVDFPYLLYQMVMNGDIEPVLDYQEGLRTRWLFGDIRQYLLNPKAAYNRNFFSIHEHDDIISREDMFPAIFGSLSLFTKN